MARCPNFQVVEGDNLPIIAVTWTNTDITGYTIILQILVDPSSSPTEVTASITDAVNGGFEFELPKTVPAGMHQARIHSDDGSANTVTFTGFNLHIPQVWS